MGEITLKTKIGTFLGNKCGETLEFLGIPYAKAGRFEYCERIDSYGGTVDATKTGSSCPQFRQYYPNLENPERLFYYKEFREGIDFKYGEDCLNLNIFTPENASGCPVIIFFHGGSFNSGSNWEAPFRGYELAKRGIITVFANYRVSILGYFSHEEIQKKYGRNGNFGLDDQLQRFAVQRADPQHAEISLQARDSSAGLLQFLPELSGEIAVAEIQGLEDQVRGTCGTEERHGLAGFLSDFCCCRFTEVEIGAAGQHGKSLVGGIAAHPRAEVHRMERR